MSIWKHNGAGWITQDWRTPVAGTAILVCPGPSLAYAPATMNGPRRTVFGINTSYPRIMPDIWIGMDKLSCYNPSLPYESFPKVFRGNYHEMSIDSIPIRLLCNNFFVDTVRANGVSDLFVRNAESLKLAWFNHTLGCALHLIVWMGYKQIVFAGCDLGGDRDYYDDRNLSKELRICNKRLYEEQERFLLDFVEMAKTNEIECLSVTPNSPINKYMKYTEWHLVLKTSVCTSPLLHAKEAFDDRAEK